MNKITSLIFVNLDNEAFYQYNSLIKIIKFNFIDKINLNIKLAFKE